MAHFPDTMEDWEFYIGSLEGEDLVSKAYAANTLSFVKMVTEEGYSPEKVEDILLLFAKRLEETGNMVPDGGQGFYVSYLDLLQ